MKPKIFLSYQIDDIEQLLPIFRTTRGLRGTPSIDVEGKTSFIKKISRYGRDFPSKSFQKFEKLLIIF